MAPQRRAWPHASERARARAVRKLLQAYITHRLRGHGIAKGVDIAGLVAEVMGKATGSCTGKGGPMHIADVDKGMLGTNDLGTLAVAVRFVVGDVCFVVGGVLVGYPFVRSDVIVGYAFAVGRMILL